MLYRLIIVVGKYGNTNNADNDQYKENLKPRFKIHPHDWSGYSSLVNRIYMKFRGESYPELRHYIDIQLFRYLMPVLTDTCVT